MSGYESAQESGENGSGSSIGDGSADEASPERGAAVPATRSRSRERTGSPMSEFADREEAQSPGSRQKASRKGKEPHRVPRMVVPKFSEGQHAGRASDDDPQEHHQETRTASQEYAPRQRSPRLQHERQEEPTLLKRKRPDDSPASQIEAEVKANLNSTNPGDQLPKWQRMPASAPKSSSGAQDTSARSIFQRYSSAAQSKDSAPSGAARSPVTSPVASVGKGSSRDAWGSEKVSAFSESARAALEAGRSEQPPSRQMPVAPSVPAARRQADGWSARSDASGGRRGDRPTSLAPARAASRAMEELMKTVNARKAREMLETTHKASDPVTVLRTSVPSSTLAEPQEAGAAAAVRPRRSPQHGDRRVPSGLDKEEMHALLSAEAWRNISWQSPQPYDLGSQRMQEQMAAQRLQAILQHQSVHNTQDSIALLAVEKSMLEVDVQRIEKQLLQERRVWETDELQMADRLHRLHNEVEELQVLLLEAERTKRKLQESLADERRLKERAVALAGQALAVGTPSRHQPGPEYHTNHRR
eukprot:CAMPEP_0117658850 /NCGR_PEP_ID=MMETSP0804-20121206/6091_1 /TAXON_ID=1074897 /ORGANISM="Tetraselmis astigmatica, Strain CCMP880" /LENGTH=530 /DNA_ID=CAMNT_0005465413 /DNA_START=730 /DNA_END=2322 /DNA_ORIENTATION=-